MFLKLLATVNTLFSQAKKKPNNDTSVFGGLVNVILMGNLYQFLPMVEKLLWEEAIIIDEFYGKAI